jgi:hypothetical protein
MKRALVLVALLSLVAAGCGSKKSSSPPAATSTESSSTSTSSSSGGSTSFASVKNCNDLKQLGTKFSQALQASSASGNFDNIAKVYSQLADAAPSAIRDDLKTLAGAVQTYVEALKKAGYKPGSTPTASQIAALQQASAAFTDPKLKAASAHLEAWAVSNCGASSSNP